MSGKPPRNQVTGPAQVRFYFDTDVLGLAHVVAGLRADATCPGDPGATIGGRRRPKCPITDTNVLDSDWIPKVAANGWTISTRDARIERRPAERQAVVNYDAEMFVITSRGNLSKWDQLEVLMSRWRQIDEQAGRPRP
ncbi:MAG: hypothetical protein OXG37_10520 [Actinomycetia bacterium]|nr:hypothetical protein [Actinomycetes bacterium]